MSPDSRRRMRVVTVWAGRLPHGLENAAIDRMFDDYRHRALYTLLGIKHDVHRYKWFGFGSPSPLPLGQCLIHALRAFAEKPTVARAWWSQLPVSEYRKPYNVLLFCSAPRPLYGRANPWVTRIGCYRLYEREQNH